MSGFAVAIALLALPVHAALLPSPAAAQEAGPLIRVTGTELSADTVLLGDRFQLRLRVHLAPGAVAFVPDSVVGRGFEPFGPVETVATAAPGGGTELEVVYPLIAFAVGTVGTPDFELYAARADESIRAGLVREGRSLGDFEAFIDNVSLVPSARLTSVPARALEVVTVLNADGEADMIAPRPPADVAGGDRDWAATLLTLLFGVVFLGVSAATARDWAAARSAASAPAGPSPREVALGSLDELLAGSLLADGRIRDFFTRSSEITRRYVEGFEKAWGPAWTGTELMNGLARRTATPDPEPLRREIDAAERVKFGGVRPDGEAAVAHVEHLRDWIAAVPGPESRDAPEDGTAR